MTFTPDGSRDDAVHRIRGQEYVNFCRHNSTATPQCPPNKALRNHQRVGDSTVSFQRYSTPYTKERVEAHLGIIVLVREYYVNLVISRGRLHLHYNSWVLSLDAT